MAAAAGLPRRRHLIQLIDGGLRLLDEPVHGLARPVVAKPVLDVVELDSGVSRQPHAAVPRPLRGVDFAVAVLPPGGA